MILYVLKRTAKACSEVKNIFDVKNDLNEFLWTLESPELLIRM